MTLTTTCLSMRFNLESRRWKSVCTTGSWIWSPKGPLDLVDRMNYWTIWKAEQSDLLMSVMFTRYLSLVWDNTRSYPHHMVEWRRDLFVRYTHQAPAPLYTLDRHDMDKKPTQSSRLKSLVSVQLRSGGDGRPDSRINHPGEYQVVSKDLTDIAK